MKQPRDTRDNVEFTLPVTITRLGHDPIIEHGTAVQLKYKNSVNLYDELNSEIDRPHPFPEDRRVSMQDAGPGLILDHRYHVCPLELMRARLRSSRGKLELEEVYQHLWYCIMFRKGHFWARYDWVEVLLKPAE